MLNKELNLALLVSVFSLSYAINDVETLLSKMDVTDKCGQMTQITITAVQKEKLLKDDYPIDILKLKKAIQDYKIGSLQNTPNDMAQKGEIWQTIIKNIHELSLNTSLKIPLIYGIDSIHGANYIQEAVLFPQPLAQAATFNIEMAEKIGEIVAMETRAVGIPWNFSPVMDIARQPIWSRIWETFGEDIVLAQRMGEAYIKGHQGTDIKAKSKAVTSLKHFIGYSAPFNGRDRTPAYIPENQLREYFLPPFESGVKSGSLIVMVNSGEVNGLPGHANYHYLTEILKLELNFNGFVISDWEDVVRLHTRDKIAESPEEAVRLAVMAGIDISMVPYDFSFYDHCVNLYKKDREFAARVENAVERILWVKQEMGYLKHSDDIIPKVEDLNLIGTKESEDISLEVARESIVLAKNAYNYLPLSKNANVIVVGPSANLLKVLNGGWSYKWQGSNESYFQTFSRKSYKTVYEAIQSKTTRNILYREGSNFVNTTNIIETIKDVLNSDVVIFCIGEDTYTETPGNIDNMMLSDSQIQLANQIFDTGIPVVVVYIGGRPRTITSIVNRANAVLIGFLPGNRGGDAIADILFGEYNPNGKMPITYPKGPNGAMTYDYKPLEGYETSLENGHFDAIFPFGHGLSYTTFEYSNLILDQAIVNEPSNLTGRVTVTNTGSRSGKEVVIVYLNDEFASLSRPVKQMKYFKKVALNPGQSVTIEFFITRYDMSFIDLKNKRIVETGKFNVYVDKLSASFQLIAKLNNKGLRSFIGVYCLTVAFIASFISKI